MSKSEINFSLSSDKDSDLFILKAIAFHQYDIVDCLLRYGAESVNAWRAACKQGDRLMLAIIRPYVISLSASEGLSQSINEMFYGIETRKSEESAAKVDVAMSVDILRLLLFGTFDVASADASCRIDPALLVAVFQSSDDNSTTTAAAVASAGSNCLHLAASLGDLEALQFLLDSVPALAEATHPLLLAQDHKGRTAIQVAEQR
jgi:hypothetical protein